ncbi:MAG TPA: ribonuclease HII [Candidatus Omnitrophica bacterium]|nr:ribonuclease HII [Candidatus Omnitrophota bacterium]
MGNPATEKDEARLLVEYLEDDTPMPTNRDLTFYERSIWRQNIKFIAGLDEAGRGPLAGPVVAAVTIFLPFTEIRGIGDSKKFSPLRRNELFELIKEKALDWGVGIVGERIIERINILEATRLAMEKAIQSLKILPQFLLIDAVTLHNVGIPQKSIIKGDEKSLSIGAASIMAKVVRDMVMQKYHRLFPEYGFNENKGYPTRKHLNALKNHGPCQIHRRTYHPVQKLLKEETEPSHTYSLLQKEWETGG